MLTGPIPATKELLAENDMTVADIDRFEINEAFASVLTVWLKETPSWERTNVYGGAIAHSHPLGATGGTARQTTLSARSVQRPVRALCDVYQFRTTIIERVE